MVNIQTPILSKIPHIVAGFRLIKQKSPIALFGPLKYYRSIKTIALLSRNVINGVRNGIAQAQEFY